MGVAADPSGDVYFGENLGQRVRKVATNDNLSTVVGNNSCSSGDGDGGPAISACIGDPWNVALDSSGNLYICEGSHIRMVNTSGFISTVAGGGSVTGTAADGGPSTLAETFPTGVAVDSTGNIYFADQSAGLVRKVDTSGIIHTVAGNGTEGYSGDNGPATLAALEYPYTVAVDSSNNIYIADRSNGRVRKVNSSGTINTIAGSGAVTVTAINGLSATSANIGNPDGLALDGSGNLYIADSTYCYVYQVNNGGAISIVAGNGTGGWSGDGGPATLASLSWPNGLSFDAAGNLYISGERGAPGDYSYIRKVLH